MFLVGIRVTVFVTLRGRVRRTLYDLLYKKMMVKLTRKARGNLVSLIEVGMHRTECISLDVTLRDRGITPSLFSLVIFSRPFVFPKSTADYDCDYD